jgi:2-methylisocitrate lyase-like PEP mutase family enzyme
MAVRSVGIAEEKIQAIPAWQTSGVVDQVELLVLGYADDLVLGGGRVTDARFDALGEHLTEVAILERRLRELIEKPGAVPVPGSGNALTARLIEDAGFDAVYVSGAAIGNIFLGAPDVGLTSLSEVAMHVKAIRDAVNLPLIVDADTGFGGVMNTWRTVRALERAGADAIQLEDQTFPKRCGHFSGKSVVSTEEMVDKIGAAREAAVDPDLLLIARTDARAEHGLAEACRRANAYRDAGADVLFVEAPLSEEEIATIAAEVSGPLMLNLVEGGVTPELSIDRISELGYSLALYANLPMLAAIEATRETLRHLRDGSAGPRPRVATWEERQRLVRRDWFGEFELRHSHALPDVLAESDEARS